MFVSKKVEQDSEIEVSTNLLGVYFLAFFYMIIFFILPTQIPFLLIDHFGASGKMAGSIIGIAFFSNAIGAITFSKLKKKFNFSTIYIIGLTIVALGFSCIGLVNNIYYFYFVTPILGFGGGIMMTNVAAWMLSKTTFEKRVKSSGYLTSFLFMGQFASPIIFHPVVSKLGVQNFFLAIGASLFILVFSASIYKKLA